MPTPCDTCLPYLADENKDAVNIFMLAINQMKYSSIGKSMGVDLNTVIEIVKLMKIDEPIETIERVMLLSKGMVKKNG